MSSYFGRNGPPAQIQNGPSSVYPQLNPQPQPWNQQQPQQQYQQYQSYHQPQQIGYGQTNAGPSYANPQGGGYGQMQPYQQQQQLQQPSQQYGSVGPYQGSGVQQQLQPQPQSQQGTMQGYQAPSYQSHYPPGPTLAQPIEGPLEGNTDNARMYGALQRAKGKIDRAMRIDDHMSPDLADKAGGNTSAPYIEVRPGLPPVAFRRHVPLPDALNHELNHKDQRARMGLFEDIGRAWFTVDNKLFLWDYNDGQDFNRYDEQAEPITAVGLVKARPDVFIDDLSHLLVICTAKKITVLGLGRSRERGIDLFSTNLVTDSPVVVTSITGTAGGRIFMTGDKTLYELEYSNDSRWFFGSGAKIWVTNRTGSALTPWTPSFLASSNREGVELVAVDSVRNRLYTLHTKGEVEYFDLASQGFRSIGRVGTTRFAQGSPIVSLQSVQRHESAPWCLVAVTAKGSRLYLHQVPSSSNVMLRYPPQGQEFVLNSTTTYSSGVLLGTAADNSSGVSATRLHMFIPEVGHQAVNREYNTNDRPYFHEFHTIQQIPSEVCAIVEIPATNPAFGPIAYEAGNGITLNPLARQAATAPREFLVLSPGGLYTFALNRPIDLVQEAMKQDRDGGYALVKSAYGLVQVTAMGVALGTEVDLKLADNANMVATVMLNGGEPMIVPSNTGNQIMFSAKHEGLALIMSRFLRPVWNRKVTVVGVGNRQMSAVSKDQLFVVQRNLESLRRFVEEENPFPSPRAPGDKKEAWDLEERSLESLRALLKQAIEAIAFIQLLDGYKMPDFVSRCDAQLQQQLAQLTYPSLLTDEKGKEVAKQLVAVLIQMQIGVDGGIDNLSDQLQAQCGSFCTSGDVVLYKAEENMRRAEGSRTASERSEYLNEALNMFNQAAQKPSSTRDVYNKLKDISSRFSALGSVAGTIELALTTAHACDPQDRATEYAMLENPNPADDRKILLDSRRFCYSTVIDALAVFDKQYNEALTATRPGDDGRKRDAAGAKRDEAYRIAIASDDELFHFALYDWHIAEKRPEDLLEFDTPFIETYLQRTNSDIADRRDLLWKYYQRREEYLPAARALFDLATRISSIDLQQRSYYLAQALASAKSAGNLDANDVDFVNTIQESMDVSNVQLEVARAIDTHVDMSLDEKAEVIGRLNSALIGLDELYQDYARPYRLYEQILLILKTADTRLDEVVEAVWRELLRSAPGYPPSDAMAEVVVDLCRKFFPSEAAPVEIVLRVVYESALPLAPASNEGWATAALLEGGVPTRECWEEVTALTETAETDEERQFYIEEAAFIAERWIDDREGNVHLADIEKFASQQLLRLSAGDMTERQHRTRDRLTRAKNAAKRW